MVLFGDYHLDKAEGVMGYETGQAGSMETTPQMKEEGARVIFDCLGACLESSYSFDEVARLVFCAMMAASPAGSLSK